MDNNNGLDPEIHCKSTKEGIECEIKGLEKLYEQSPKSCSTTIKIGDEITINVHRNKEGEPMGATVKVTYIPTFYLGTEFHSPYALAKFLNIKWQGRKDYIDVFEKAGFSTKMEDGKLFIT